MRVLSFYEGKEVFSPLLWLEGLRKEEESGCKEKNEPIIADGRLKKRKKEKKKKTARGQHKS